MLAVQEVARRTSGHQCREYHQSPKLTSTTTAATRVTVRGIRKPVMMIPSADPRRGRRAGNERTCSRRALRTRASSLKPGYHRGALSITLPAHQLVGRTCKRKKHSPIVRSRSRSPSHAESPLLLSKKRTGFRSGRFDSLGVFLSLRLHHTSALFVS